MGIKDFHKWIKQDYSNCVKSYWLSEYDHCYIDLNYALHFISFMLTDKDDIYEKVYSFIMEILKTTLPNKSLTLAIDGVPPLSKLLTQRKRRLDKALSSKDDENKKINTIMFTPGTKFMDELEENMKPYFNRIKKLYNIKINILMTDVDEAEIKLKNQLVENMKNDKNDTHIFVSSDADVIVMLMALDNLSKIFILNKSFKDISIIYLGSLINEHIKKVGCSLHPNLDFTAVNIFLGNDYLPKLSFLTIEKLWMAYKNTLINHPKGFIIDNIQVNKIFLIKLLFNIIQLTKQNMFKIDKNIKSSKNYFDGYIWCLNMYVNGSCERYDYFYNKNNGLPQPFQMILELINNDNLLIKKNNNQENCVPINKKLYTILVLPKKYSNLIQYLNEKYKKFIDKNSIIYKIETCEKCKLIRNNVSYTEEENKKKLLLHKKKHSDISENDIIKINKKYKKIFV